MNFPNLAPLAAQLQWLALRCRGKEADMYQSPQAYEQAVLDLEGRKKVARAVCSIIGQHFHGKRPQTARDLACGTGIVTHELAKVCDNVTGSDLSPAMLEYARRTKDQNIQWREEDFHRLQGNDAATDVITMIGAARYAQDPHAFFQGIHRLLSKDGIAVLSYADTARSKVDTLFRSEKAAGLFLASIQEYPLPDWIESMPVILQRGLWRLAQHFRDMSIRVLCKEPR